MYTINRIWAYGRYRLKFFTNITLPQATLAFLLPKRILAGPFTGMRYRAQSTGSVLLPKLIGSYESELWPVFEKVRQGVYDVFVDVGAAEGYYAVGVSKYIFQNHVATIAFEATKKGQKQISKLARLNHVHDITVQGYCDKTSLGEALSGKRSFIVMDVEGGELDLLDIDSVSELINSDILVEIHPEVLPSIKEIICARFEQTHAIHEYKINPDKSFPERVKLHFYIDPYKQYMLNEFRGNQSWLFLEAKLGRS